MKLLTLARDLQRRKGRERQEMFVAEGIRCVEELMNSTIAVVGALVDSEREHTARAQALTSTLQSRGVETLELSHSDFISISDTESSQGIAAIARIPDVALSSLQFGVRATIVILDGLQDPGNVGTIIRTAAAFGADALVAAPGTVDLWNSKVVRGAMGANFHIPVVAATWEEIDECVEAASLVVWGADAGGAEVRSTPVPERVVLVVGNEGAGLSADARSRARHTVSLAIRDRVESLNVAVATGILLYELRS